MSEKDPRRAALRHRPLRAEPSSGDATRAVMFRNQYDQDVLTWSPQGRLHQVECARPPRAPAAPRPRRGTPVGAGRSARLVPFSLAPPPLPPRR